MMRAHRAGYALVLSVVALAAAGTYAVTSARPFDANAVTNAALNAVARQYTAAQAAVPTELDALFTGNALKTVAPMRTQVLQNIAAGQDYPGPIELTNATVVSIQGTASSVVLDLSVHEKLSNMRGGSVVDYSQSDVIYHLTLDNVNGRWLVSDLAWQFAPNGGP